MELWTGISRSIHNRPLKRSTPLYLDPSTSWKGYPSEYKTTDSDPNLNGLEKGEYFMVETVTDLKGIVFWYTIIHSRVYELIRFLLKVRHFLILLKVGLSITIFLPLCKFYRS